MRDDKCIFEDCIYCAFGVCFAGDGDCPDGAFDGHEIAEISLRDEDTLRHIEARLADAGWKIQCMDGTILLTRRP